MHIMTRLQSAIHPGGLQTNINNIYCHDLSTEVSCIDEIRIKNNK